MYNLILNLVPNKVQTLTIQDLKRKGSQALPDEGATYLIVNSKIKSAILPIKEYEQLMEAMEELEDIKAIKERKNEKTISFEKAFKQ